MGLGVANIADIGSISCIWNSTKSWPLKIIIIWRALICLLSMWAATSKFDQLTDIDGATGSFGFRGESLGSISDVSLLEIVTKAHGRPNGYRKVIKAWIFLWKLSNLWIFSLLFVTLLTLIDLLPFCLFFSFIFWLFLRDASAYILELMMIDKMLAPQVKYCHCWLSLFFGTW